MATSIRDLVRALESEAPYRAGTNRQTRDAAGALYELGRGLRQLAIDGLDLEINGPRENITHDLAASCMQHAATTHLDPSGRLTGLAGGIADVIGVLREETRRDQRWAIAVELASAARVVTTYAAEGDGRRTADLAWTHLTARALIVRALQDTPRIQSQAILDRALPGTMLSREVTPTQVAMESLTVISDRLRRANVELSRRPTLLEVFSVSRAVESTTRYATVTAGVLAGEPAADARPASAIWYEVRDRLRPFTTAAPLHLEDRDLGLWAQRAHSALRREFGSPEQPQVTVDGQVKAQAVQHLQVMVNEVPMIADHLVTSIQHLADHGDLHALATRLPFREERLQPFLAKRAVVADRFDVAPVMDRLGDAAKLAAELATTLERAVGTSWQHSQPGLTAANAARAAESRPDPQSALTERVRDGMRMNADHEAASLHDSDAHHEPLLTDELDRRTAPDFDLE